MKCPYCNKNTELESPVLYNVQAYQSSVKARTYCCGKIVRVSPVFSYRVEETEQVKEDDWGN
jgi:hypothetical protein